MSEIMVYKDENLISNKFLQRLQNPTDPGMDTCNTSLLEVFIREYGHRKDELMEMRKKSMDEVNEFFTKELTDEELGFVSGKHPSRTFDQTEKYLNRVISFPLITFELQEDGRIEYEKMPLIKQKKTSNGKHVVVFNDMLLDHIVPPLDPSKGYGKCSWALLKEIKKVNIVAGLLYEEGCRRKYAYNKGNAPFFNFTEKEIRQKLSFDKMEFTDDMKEYKTVKIKAMRSDKIRSLILKPAIETLIDFFNQGKTDFWLEMSTFLEQPKKEGRPPKKNFHFVIHKRSFVSNSAPINGTTQSEKFDEYEEINALSEIRTELEKTIRSNELREYILGQIKERENEDSSFSVKVLHKITDLKSRLSDSEYRKGHLLLTALWYDCDKLGKEPPTKRMSKGNVPNWNEFSLEQKIEFMQNSHELLDEACEIGLSPDQTKAILAHDFVQYCTKYGKPLKDWDDAYSLFFSWYNKINSTPKSNGSKRNNTDGASQAVLNLFNEQ